MATFNPKTEFEKRRIVARAEFDENFSKVGKTQTTECGKRMKKLEQQG